MPTPSLPAPESLHIIHFPDPRLRKRADDVLPEEFGPQLTAIVQRLFELMRQDRGVGLAAPQVGWLKRLFVMNHSGKPEDDRVYINPTLTDPEGTETDEEGCLSLPGIRANIARDFKITVTAQDLTGRSFTETAEGYVARVWQHEYDHLNGTLLIDRMGPVARMQCRKKLKELEEKFLRSLKIPTSVP
ncbi:MAG: peptide deformylase [Tepidisphaerales bacterium]